MSHDLGLEVVRRHLERLAGLNPVTLHVHGSLALGGYRHGISDQDVVVLLSAPLDTEARRVIGASHRSAGPLLSCAYVLDAKDHEARHPTWTHGWSGDRRVSLITRAELAQGLTLHGPPAEAMWPRVPNLTAVVTAEVTRAWQAESRKRVMWWKAEWVDLALTSLGRAHLTAQRDALVSKDEAIAHLRSLGVDATVVDGIAARREGQDAGRTNRLRRAVTARREVRRLLASL